MQLPKKFSLLFLILLCSSCLKNEVITSSSTSWDDYFYDCEFVEIEDNQDYWFTPEEAEIIETCKDNRLESVSEIKQSLIGEWELVAHSNDGWLIGLENQPCAKFWIEESELVLGWEDVGIDTIFQVPWDIVEEHGRNRLEFGDQIYYLDNLDVFCNGYIVGGSFCDDCYKTVFERK